MEAELAKVEEYNKNPSFLAKAAQFHESANAYKEVLNLKKLWDNAIRDCKLREEVAHLASQYYDSKERYEQRYDFKKLDMMLKSFDSLDDEDSDDGLKHAGLDLDIGVSTFRIDVPVTQNATGQDAAELGIVQAVERVETDPDNSDGEAIRAFHDSVDGTPLSGTDAVDTSLSTLSSESSQLAIISAQINLTATVLNLYNIWLRAKLVFDYSHPALGGRKFVCENTTDKLEFHRRSTKGCQTVTWRMPYMFPEGLHIFNHHTVHAMLRLKDGSSMTLDNNIIYII